MSIRFKADLQLLGAALVWGLAFAAQRYAAGQVSFMLFNGLRFLLAVLVLLPAAAKFRLQIKKPDLFFTMGVGVVLFVASAFQQAGLKYTTAGNAGFITSLYVVLTPIVLLLVWRQKTHWGIWLAAGVACLGALLLSAGGLSLRLAPGDGLELCGALLWAFHLILVGKAMQRMELLPFAIVQYLTAGVLSLVMALVWEDNSLAGVVGSAWAILYTAVFSVAIGYTLQARGQRHAPPADAALLLSLESVFAAAAGGLLLGERLAPAQILGCGLILAAVIGAQFLPRQSV